MRIDSLSKPKININVQGIAGQKANILSNKQMSPLQKQKELLKEQIKKVQQSDLSKESKDQTIKDLQDKLKDIDEQIAQEKQMKLQEGPEVKKTKAQKEEEEKKAEQKDEGSTQVIDKEAIEGIVSAASHEKIGKVSYDVYKKAVREKDMVKAQRALRYTMAEIKKSYESKRLMVKGSKVYKKEMDKQKEIEAKQNEGTAENAAATGKVLTSILGQILDSGDSQNKVSKEKLS